MSGYTTESGTPTLDLPDRRWPEADEATVQRIYNLRGLAAFRQQRLAFSNYVLVVTGEDNELSVDIDAPCDIRGTVAALEILSREYSNYVKAELWRAHWGGTARFFRIRTYKP